MKISVIIPAFNEASYIDSCLASLKNQVSPPFEIIVVDNNSTDKTPSIAKKHGVRVLFEPKQSTIAARNRGFSFAVGDIVARLDADAIAPPDWIKRIKDNFASESVSAVSGTACFDELGLLGKTYFYVNFFSIFMRKVLKHHILIGPNMAIKKTLWNKIKDEVCIDDRNVHEDIDLSIHVAKYGHIAFDPQLKVQISARRIKSNPFSFFIEYPIRLIKTILNHKT